MVGEVLKKSVSKLKQFIKERSDKEDPGENAQNLFNKSYGDRMVIFQA